MLIRDAATQKVLLRIDEETFEINESNSPEIESLWLDWMENGINIFAPAEIADDPDQIVDGGVIFFPGERLGLLESILAKRGLILEI